MFKSNLLVYLFSGVLIFSATLVIVASHSVFSLFFLALSFVNLAFLLLMLECEFLALIFIVVYVGAIAVLFLFAVMMLDAKVQNSSRNTRNSFRFIPLGFLLTLGFLVPVLYKILSRLNESFVISGNYANWYDLIDSFSDINVYGQVLYSYFVVQFLVVVLIRVVYLTNNYTTNKTVEQSTYKQLAINSKFFYEVD